MTTNTREAADFFYEHAGYSYDATRETAEQGRRRCAEELARAERVGQSRGWWHAVEDDWDDGADPDDDGETTRAIERGELQRLNVWLAANDGRVLAQLGSVIVREETDPYIRVVAAELAADVLASHAECGAEAQCGGCGYAWCGVCDPAPSALCHRCHGRGYSTAELPHADRGSISTEPGKPCLRCAAVGRLTWLGEDGTCRREDVHR